eukprot:6191718-Pleurochrysis_carterae.AAC.2
MSHDGARHGVADASETSSRLTEPHTVVAYSGLSKVTKVDEIESSVGALDALVGMSSGAL